MCISPDEMTSAELEAEVVGLERLLGSDRVQRDFYLKNYYRERIKGLEALLKERVEAGTY